MITNSGHVYPQDICKISPVCSLLYVVCVGGIVQAVLSIQYNDDSFIYTKVNNSIQIFISINHTLAIVDYLNYSCQLITDFIFSK